MAKFINIQFPFSDSGEGFLLNMTKTSAEAVKSDLIHLVLTRKGTRYYKPEFGTNLDKFLFDPNDGTTEGDIKTEIREAVNKFIPNLKIDDVIIDQSESDDHQIKLRIEYTFTEDIFQQTDFVVIEI